MGLLCLTPMVRAAGDIEKVKPVVTKDLLSKHETVAVFKGTEFHRCMGRTSACPEKCGHSGLFAQFTIKEYTGYERPGKYGDKKQEKYRFQISDFESRPVGDKEILALIKKLKVGDEVILNWSHNYVTQTTGKFSSKSPERLVTKLEKR